MESTGDDIMTELAYQMLLEILVEAKSEEEHQK